MRLIKILIAFVALVSLQIATAQWLHVPPPVEAKNLMIFTAVVPVVVAGDTPAYGGEIAKARLNSANTNAATATITVSPVSAGNLVVVSIHYNSVTQTVTSVTDSRSNTYILEPTTIVDSFTIVMASSIISTGLQDNDVITANFGSVAYCVKTGTAVYFTDVTETDTHKEAVLSGTTINAAATVADNSVQFGMVGTSERTYSSPATGWTLIGDVLTNNRTENWYFYYGTFATGGSVSPGGTLSANNTYWARWVSFK